MRTARRSTAIAMSGAYNRTLTPFGFQNERRSFCEATEIYTTISAFFYALVGKGAPVRYVELPEEGHHYWARESVLDAAAEMIEWLERTIGPPPSRAVVARIRRETPPLHNRRA